MQAIQKKRSEEALGEAYEKIRVYSEELHTSNEELQTQSEGLHKANEALHESEERFRTLTENSPDVITRFDRQNRHMYANPATAEVYGLSQEEIIGKTHSELGRGPEQVKFWERHNEKVFITGKSDEMEFQYTSPQGKEYYFNTRIVPEFFNGKVGSVLSISRDIRDIKEAEVKLREILSNLEEKVKERTAELEEVYDSLLENELRLNEAQKIAHIGSWDRNLVTGELYWSDEMYRIFRLDPIELGATYDAFLNYVHPDDRDHVYNSHQKALNGDPINIDYRIILADREERIVHAQGEAIFDERSTPVQTRGIIQDITDRKKAEERIQTLANAVESSDDAIVTESLECVITSWNKGAEQIYGYSAEEVLGKDISILETADLKGEVRQLIKKIKQGKNIRHYETLRLKNDGTIINVSITLSPIFNASGELVAISSIVRDITERRKAEEAVRLSNIYNRSLIEASLDPLVTIGPDGKITDVNTSTETATGRSRYELIGTDFSNYFTDPEKANKGYQLVFREGLVRDYQLEIQHKNGRIIPVLYNASIYKNEVDEVTGIFAAARDITELKIAEETLRQSEEKYRNLFNNMIEGFILYEVIPDSEGNMKDLRYVEINKVFEKTVGAPRDKILGNTVMNFFPQVNPHYMESLAKTASTGQSQRIEWHSPILDRWFESHSYVYKPGYIGVVFRDITERKKAEEKIQESEEKYRTIIETANEGIWIVDPEFRTTYVNEKMADVRLQSRRND